MAVTANAPDYLDPRIAAAAARALASGVGGPCQCSVRASS